MSISGALQTGVSGMQAQSTAMGRISENVANISTDGYRRSFAQMVTQANGVGQAAKPSLGVRAMVVSDVESPGAIRSTGKTTDMAISGPGFFPVARIPNETIEDNFALTRAGAFNVDGQGFMRNSAGFYLQGFAYDDNGMLGDVARTRFGDLVPVNIANTSMAAAQTTDVGLRGNLPAQAAGLAAPGDPFVSSSLYYTPTGKSEQLRFSWQPSSTANEWTLTVGSAAGADYGSVDVTFTASGALAGTPQLYAGVTDLSGSGIFAADPATGELTLNLPTEDGATQVVNVSLGGPGTFSGVTQFAGSFQPLSVEANGNAFGTIMRTEIDPAGDLYGVFDNGMRKALFNIPVVTVDSPNNLRVLDGNAYGVSAASGSLSLMRAGDTGAGGIVSGALEGSNVDIAQELTALIQTQRAFSSNAKIITTADEMTDEAIRMKR